jgi:dihydroceramidase
MSWIADNTSNFKVVGYWEPHSSSVDFCEMNYHLSPHIAEFHNSWSSLLISLMGLIGIFYANPTNEWRFFVSYLVLVSIGLGSFLLHTTLHWLPQSSDEVPMLWLMISILYSLIEANYPKGNPRWDKLPYVFFIWTAAQTYIYYRYQTFYAAFLTVFISTVLVVTVWCRVLSRNPSHDAKTRQLLERLLQLGLLIFSSGSALWIFEMNFCSLVLPYLMALPTGGMTLHIIWHITAGFGGYITIFFLTALRQKILKVDADIVWIGLFPVWRVNKKVRKE